MAFDFGKLEAQETTLPKRHGGRTRKYTENPFLAWVGDSYQSKTGRSVTVPKSQLSDVQYLIRAAASDLGIGVRIVVTGAKGEQLDREAIKKSADTRNIKVAFQGQEKRKYEKKATQDTPTA